MKQKKELFVIWNPPEKAKENEPRKNETFISFNDKLISNAKSKEQDDYTIEIDAIKENDIKTNIKEKSISNNYPVENNIKKILGKLTNYI